MAGVQGWTVPDPYDESYQPNDPQSFNRYVYARNNPLTYTDPSGLQQGTNGDPPIAGSGDDCTWICGAFTFVVDFCDALFGIDFGQTFNGNVPAQSQGKFVRQQLTHNPNASHDDPVALASSRGFTGYVNGAYFFHGDPSTAPNKYKNFEGSYAQLRNAWQSLPVLRCMVGKGG